MTCQPHPPFASFGTFFSHRIGECYNNFSWEKEPHDDSAFPSPIQTLSFARKSVVLFLLPQSLSMGFFSLSLHVFFPHDVLGLIFVWKARSGWKIQFTVIVTFVSRERVRKGFCVLKEKMFTLRFFKSPSEMLHREIVAWSFRIYKKSPLICPHPHPRLDSNRKSYYFRSSL